MAEQAPIRRDPKYRSNHNRSVSISGIIDDTLVSRLLPEIVTLQDASREPITVYIDSPGGDTESARLLLDALRASDQDRSEQCRLITVALGEASSAASDILMAGDYALAYPNSRILCHGMRHFISRPTALTRDIAASFAKDMAGLDEEFAITLARNCINRFMFRISRVWRAIESLDDIGAGLFGDNDVPTARGIAQEFHRFLKTNGFVREAVLEQLDVAGLSANSVILFAGRNDLLNVLKTKGDVTAKKEAIRTSILNDALAKASSETDFGSLESKYQLLSDFLEKHHVDVIGGLVSRWSTDLYGRLDRQSATSAKLSEEEHSSNLIRMRITAHLRCFSLWFFFVFFCRQLQTGDFPMTATEAYWLGLIDEVIGLDFASPRRLVENAPDIPPSLNEGFQGAFHS